MWKLANRAVVWAGPGLPALYFGSLSLAAEAAPENEAASAYLDGQIEMIEFLLSDATALLWLFLMLLAWAFAVWGTDYMDKRRETKARKIANLGSRAQTCADGIKRLMALYDQREAVASQHAWRHKEDRDYFTASASVMSDYDVLFGSEALAIVKNAERQGIPLEKSAVSNAEHPANPLGVREVARNLVVLADRIRTNDFKQSN
ncbi:hypothetical protein A3711_14185 [Erythrobacter sp. HI00D59]|nr:hypothetical protein A3711_14185 [Erythrobacter sp. HI00D59]